MSLNIALERIQNNSARLSSFRSPNPQDNMHNFLLNRQQKAFTTLGCTGTNPFVAIPRTQNFFYPNVMPTPNTTTVPNVLITPNNQPVIQNNLGLIIGLSVGAGVIVVAGILAAVVIKRRYKNRDSLKDSFL
jgi:hypothetical protein